MDSGDTCEPADETMPAPAYLNALIDVVRESEDPPARVPLTTVVSEILSWIELAGIDGWGKADNRKWLLAELQASWGDVRAELGKVVRGRYDLARRALAALSAQPPIAKTHPGQRDDELWVKLRSTMQTLLDVLLTDSAVEACWDDIVALQKDPALEGLEYREATALLLDILRRRGVHINSVTSDVRNILKHGAPMFTSVANAGGSSPEERIRRVRALLAAPEQTEHIAVWFGYEGGYVDHVETDNVMMLDARWAAEDAQFGRWNYPHKAELAEVMMGGYLFRTATRLGEEPDVTFLMRVDLGETARAGAVERAEAIADTLINVAVHRSNGARPHRIQYAIVRDGRPAGEALRASQKDPGIPDDHHGERMTAEALATTVREFSQVITGGDLPAYLRAALDAQTDADLPFSRSHAFRRPSEADRQGIIPHTDRVVQLVAAYATLAPDDLFVILRGRWAHLRWDSDVRRAVDLCLSYGSADHGRVQQLRWELAQVRTSAGWGEFLATHECELVELCPREHQRSWNARMFRSVRDREAHVQLIAEYEAEAVLLGARRACVRNALVHGNPVQFTIVESVRAYAEVLSEMALRDGLHVFTSSEDAEEVLKRRSGLHHAFDSGMTAAEYWLSTAETAPN